MEHTVKSANIGAPVGDKCVSGCSMAGLYASLLEEMTVMSKYVQRDFEVRE